MSDQEFLDIFLDEAVDMLTAWEKACLSLEGRFSQDQCDALFRSAHNLKGSSRSVGLMAFGAFVHKVEDVITLVKSRKLQLTPELVRLMLDCQTVLLDWTSALRLHPAHDPVEDRLRLEKKLASVSSVGVEEQGYGAPETPKNIGQILVEDGAVTADQLSEAVRLQQRKIGEVLVEQGISPEAVGKALEKQKEANLGRVDESIRVSLSKLDQLIHLIGELSIQQAIIRHGTMRGDNVSLGVAQTLSQKITKELQAQAMSLRMVPLEGLFQRLERIARDVARSLGKKIALKTVGGHVELDKMLVEKMTDTLAHIVRNAVDHGIDTVDERRRAKKQDVATVTFSAVQLSNSVTITIAEDGRGLNDEKIRAKAVEKGLIKSDAKLNAYEVHQLIMVPGFSTAEKITDISGRGVGLDVVSRTVQESGGSLTIHSALGHGSAFAVTLPASLSIMDAMVIEIDRLQYAIPVQDLEEIIDLAEFRIERLSDQGQAIEMRGGVIPLHRLATFLPLNRPPAPTKGQIGPATKQRPALISKHVTERVAFEVDRVIGQQQIVVRQLHGRLREFPGVSGSTVLGNGEPGLIVNLPAFAKQYFDSMGGRHGRRA